MATKNTKPEKTTHTAGPCCEETFEQLITFSAIGKAVTSSFDLKVILNTVMEKIGVLFEPKDWSLLFLDSESGELTYEIAVGEGSDELKESNPKIGEGIVGWVAAEGVPLLVPNIKMDPRFSKSKLPRYDSVEGPIICVPLMTKGKILGVIELFNVKDGSFHNEKDMLLFRTLADYTAIAVENAMLFKRVQELTITDDLTLLHNSRYFAKSLDIEVEKADRYNHSLSMIFLDLDYFKSVNDVHGHIAGSTLLKEVGTIIADCIRNVDIACRYGGDEFVILLPDTNKKNALMIANRMRESVNEYVFLKELGLEHHITASFGVGTFPDDASSKKEFLHVTDKAMYSVKEASRDGVAAHGVD
ncbi:MAG: sensor domain-containing diguanylate cyclase [Thermodesulfobacteriota bacterium]